MLQIVFLLLLALPLLRLLVALLWPDVLKRIEGHRSESMLVSQFGEIREDPLVQEVGARLLAARPVRASFGVLSGDLRNAVALPNGRVLVWEGLLKETHGDRDMLAGVLAHELGHLSREHFLHRVQGFALARFVLGLLGGGWLRRALHGAAASVVARGFSRSQEWEADSEALQIMRAAGFNPVGLARLLERLARTRAQVGGFLGSHPDPIDRAQRIRAVLGLPAQTSPLPEEAEEPTEAPVPDNILPFPLHRIRATSKDSSADG